MLASFLAVPELRSREYYLIGLQSGIELASAAVKTFDEIEKYRALFYYVCEYPHVNIRSLFQTKNKICVFTSVIAKNLFFKDMV